MGRGRAHPLDSRFRGNDGGLGGEKKMDSRFRGNDGGLGERKRWIPACAGMTEGVLGMTGLLEGGNGIPLSRE